MIDIDFNYRNLEFRHEQLCYMMILTINIWSLLMENGDNWGFYK